MSFVEYKQKPVIKKPTKAINRTTALLLVLLTFIPLALGGIALSAYYVHKIQVHANLVAHGASTNAFLEGTTASALDQHINYLAQTQGLPSDVTAVPTNESVRYVFATQTGQKVHSSDDVPYNTYLGLDSTKIHLTVYYLPSNPRVNQLKNSVYGNVVGYAMLAVLIAGSWIIGGFAILTIRVDARKDPQRFKKVAKSYLYPAIPVLVIAATILMSQIYHVF